MHFTTYLCLLLSDDSMPVAGDKGGDNKTAEGVMVKDCMLNPLRELKSNATANPWPVQNFQMSTFSLKDVAQRLSADEMMQSINL
ncbi:hypothetical protein L873DRAFT_1823240 [Choiromyces venosus 120613-1]|uniref:Uncharacterized protein n=1 Tax=Choiromyces venosus 120613-1 TaxID=1336337 RepID=A0A3N4ITI8_9PEZI|nr:hypothetical protein L873DRAFT_1823240 [Choiromyces venosus 120613-1]